MTSVIMNHDDLLAGSIVSSLLVARDLLKKQAWIGEVLSSTTEIRTGETADLKRLICIPSTTIHGEKVTGRLQMEEVTARGCVVITCHLDFDSSKKELSGQEPCRSAVRAQVLPACQGHGVRCLAGTRTILYINCTLLIQAQVRLL